MSKKKGQHTEAHQEGQAPEAAEIEEAPVEAEAGEAVQPGDDDLAALQQELEAVKAKEAEYLDGWQRAQAELANARKRFQREQQQSYANARADVLSRLLPVVDDFERAMETLPAESPEQTWSEGVRMILHKLNKLLEQEGVEPIEALGQEFDPFLHQAITHEPSAQVPSGHVLGVVQKGYKVGDRVLRPSMVRVSAGELPEPEAAGEAEPEAESDTDETENQQE